MNLTAIEDALHAWAVAATGVAADHVLWANQNSGRPAGAWVTLARGAIIGPGSDRMVVSNTSGSPPSGAEVTHTARGRRELPVTLAVYDAAVTGAGSALAVAEQARASLNKPSVRAQLRAAGIVVFDHGDVRDVPALDAVGFEGRAVLEIRCYVAEVVSETSGYIASAIITDLDTGQEIETP